MKPIYYRRTGQPYAFPADTPRNVEVTDEPQTVGVGDGDWYEVDIDTDYPAAVCLTECLTEPYLIADSLVCEAAIMLFLGVTLPMSGESLCPWKPSDLDHAGEDAHEALCDAVELIYGDDIALRQRDLLRARLSGDYLRLHGLRSRRIKEPK